MNIKDIVTRIVIALIAGLTFLGSHVPADMPISDLAILPASVWILFLVNLLTGYVSPSIVSKATEKVKGAT